MIFYKAKATCLKLFYFSNAWHLFLHLNSKTKFRKKVWEKLQTNMNKKKMRKKGKKSEDIKKYIEHQQRKSSLYTCHAISHMDVAKRIFSSSKKG